MRATSAYFVVVTLLFVAQVLLGIVTAHYAVEGQGLYGLPLSDLFPYSVTRTWHTQLAVLWIATAWLGTGLYVAPLLGGREPRFQAAGRLVLARQPRRDRSRLIRRRVVGDQPHDRRRHAEFLVRSPGLRVRGPRAVLANLPVRRTASLGRARAARRVAGVAPAAGGPLADRPRCRLDGGDRAAVRSRSHVRQGHAHLDRGVLALVGRAPVGRRRIRGFRDRDRVRPTRAHGARASFRRDHVRARGHDHISRRWSARHVPSSVLQRHADRRDSARQCVLRARGRSARRRGLRSL